MQPFTTLEAVAAPLPMINVDTDMIIPKNYLKTIKRTGLGRGLFAEISRDDDGNPDPDGDVCDGSVDDNGNACVLNSNGDGCENLSGDCVFYSGGSGIANGDVLRLVSAQRATA